MHVASQGVTIKFWTKWKNDSRVESRTSSFPLRIDFATMSAIEIVAEHIGFASVPGAHNYIFLVK